MAAPLPPPDVLPPPPTKGHELYRPWAGPGARLPHVWLRRDGSDRVASSLEFVSLHSVMCGYECVYVYMYVCVYVYMYMLVQIYMADIYGCVFAS